MDSFTSYTNSRVIFTNTIWLVINYNPRSQISQLYSAFVDNDALQDAYKGAQLFPSKEFIFSWFFNDTQLRILHNL